MLVLNLMLIGLAVAVDPLPLTAFLVVLPSRRGTVKGAAFVFGWLVSLVTNMAVPSGLKPSGAKDRRDSNFPYVVPA